MFNENLQIQKMYADRCSQRLELVRIQSFSPYRSNFRRHICGDSHTNKFKRRAFILEKNGSLIYYCHNQCGTIPFVKYLKEYHGDLYTQYRFDTFKPIPKEIPVPVVRNKIPDKTVETLDLPKANDILEAKQYMDGRLIPEGRRNDIFYTDKFYEFVNTILPNKFDDNLVNQLDKRIVLPLRDFNGKIFGLVGRSISKGNDLRYLTIRFNDSQPKIFGMDRLNLEKLSYVVEGPIDSLFLDNGIALAGTDGSPWEIFKDNSQYAMVLDNQPRSRDVS